MTIGIASDHRGYKLKKLLKENLSNYNIIDYGTDSEESVDFPIYAEKLGRAIQKGEVDFGVAICGTGIGMSITLNKMKGVYCAKVSNLSEVMLSRLHNNANTLAMSEDISIEAAIEMVNKFVETPFSNINKYIKRNDMIRELEND